MPKKPEEPEKEPVARRYGTLIRVSDEFARRIKKGSALREMSISDYADSILMPVLNIDIREAAIEEADQSRAMVEKEGTILIRPPIVIEQPKSDED